MDGSFGRSVVMSVIGDGDLATAKARLLADNARVLARMTALFGPQAAGTKEKQAGGLPVAFAALDMGANTRALLDGFLQLADNIVATDPDPAAALTALAEEFVDRVDSLPAEGATLKDMLYKDNRRSVARTFAEHVAALMDMLDKDESRRWSASGVAGSPTLEGGAFATYLQRANEAQAALRSGQKSLARLNESLGRRA